MPWNIITKFGAAILMIGFVYFILIRAIDTRNYKRKSLYLFISGFILFIFFIGGLVYDVYFGGIKLIDQPIGYYSFIIVSFVFWAFFSIFYLVKGIKNRQRFSSHFGKPTVKVRDVKPTIKDKKEFVYIILKHENDFLLQKYEQNNQEYYKGIVIKFPHNEYFHDEIIQKFIHQNQLDVINYSHVGKATKHLKEDHVYYCYKIFLSSIPSKFSNLNSIDSYNLVSCNLEEMDKKIIFTSVVENNFDINI